MIKTTAALLLFCCSPLSAFDPASFAARYAPGAGAPTTEEASGPWSDDPDLAARLRAEAAADPGKFIDERTPFEVGLAFNMQPSRYLIPPERVRRAWLVLTVDLSAQRLTALTAETKQEFVISSGLPPKYATPGSGKCYAPDFLEEMHYSSLYSNAPMPHSVFFNGNIAMHGTNAERQLGRPASHGCVRLSKKDAKTVYELVKEKGARRTAICVKGVTPV